MADATGKTVKVVVVTPEKAAFEGTADFVVLPMYDGELGVLPGRAPLIGRLGAGELRLTTGTAATRFYVEPGFAQVRADVGNDSIAHHEAARLVAVRRRIDDARVDECGC